MIAVIFAWMETPPLYATICLAAIGAIAPVIVWRWQRTPWRVLAVTISVVLAIAVTAAELHFSLSLHRAGLFGNNPQHQWWQYPYWDWLLVAAYFPTAMSILLIALFGKSGGVAKRPQSNKTDS